MFLKNTLDRSSELRNDKAWIEAQFKNKKSCIVPVHNMNILCKSILSPAQSVAGVYLTYQDLQHSLESVGYPIFMGVLDSSPCFSVEINSIELASQLCSQNNATFQDLKPVMTLLDHTDFEVLSLARYMAFWHLRHQYCGKCGNITLSYKAGHVRICQSRSCGEYYFPSMDPAIIVLIISGERCLLGRQKEWREGMYSTLAGFVEPGETPEEAVAREVQEEAGIYIGEVEYQYSQSWLYPNSLMLGFTAIAKSEDIMLGRDELEDARWFTRKEIILNPKTLPYENSIAYKLIMKWLDEDIVS